MDKLLEILGQELFDQVKAKLNGQEVFLHNAGEKVIIDDGKLVPQYRIKEINDQKTALQAQLDQNEKDLKKLKEAAKGNDDLVKQIETLQIAAKDAKTEYAAKEVQIKKEFALKEALLNAGATNEDARDLLVGKFQLADLELDKDGKIKGFDELVKPIKENEALKNLFTTTEIKGQEHHTGKLPGGGKFYTKEEVNQMSPEAVEADYDNIAASMAQWNTEQNNQ